jgi:hypothetical protein
MRNPASVVNSTAEEECMNKKSPRILFSCRRRKGQVLKYYFFLLSGQGGGTVSHCSFNLIAAYS